MAELPAEWLDEDFDDLDDVEGGDCYWCGGDGWVECNDPLQCTYEHRHFTSQAGTLYQECPCSSCGGSGLAKDMTIW